MFVLNLVDKASKKKCELGYDIGQMFSSNNVIICPKIGSKRYVSAPCMASVEDQVKLWHFIDNAAALYCYDFDFYPISTQQMIYHIKGKNVFIYTRVRYIRDPAHFADNDYLYRIYIDTETELSVDKRVKFQQMP